MIKGWSEALKMMPVGSKWEIYVPPDLAYGNEGYGQDIAPGETLIFEIELLSIKNPSKKALSLKEQEESDRKFQQEAQKAWYQSKEYNKALGE